MEYYFFSIFLIIIILTRLFLYFYPTPSPTLGKFRIHHYMYGIIGIIVGFYSRSIIIYAAGVGLFIDELTYLLMGGMTHKDNYSKTSLIGTLFFIILVYFLQSEIVSLINI